MLYRFLFISLFVLTACNEVKKTTNSPANISIELDHKISDSLQIKGKRYAFATKALLGKNLLKAIQGKGTVGAIKFCNTEAMPLTDSISVMKNAIIKRVTDKPRNIANKANTEELGYISYYKKLLLANKEPKPIVKTENNEVSFYFPITTNGLCMQCHGKPNDQITPETLTTLKRLYPKDAAIGYGINEVRGIWVIKFAE